MTWYKKAAALGETPAMFKLGMIMWKGLLGQARNLRDGLIWLKRAADQADESNQHALHELVRKHDDSMVSFDADRLR
jgi:TPR repeat protein